MHDQNALISAMAMIALLPDTTFCLHTAHPDRLEAMMTAADFQHKLLVASSAHVENAPCLLPRQCRLIEQLSHGSTYHGLPGSSPDSAVPGFLPLPNLMLGVEIDDDEEMGAARVSSLCRTPASCRYLLVYKDTGPLCQARRVGEETLVSYAFTEGTGGSLPNLHAVGVVGGAMDLDRYKAWEQAMRNTGAVLLDCAEHVFGEPHTSGRGETNNGKTPKTAADESEAEVRRD
jgi:hypothetical protein